MDIQLLKAQKHELVKTTNTRGWSVIQEIAEEVVREAERKVMECDDESKVIALQRKAQASRAFLNEFLARIQKMKDVDLPETANEFIPVATD